MDNVKKDIAWKEIGEQLKQSGWVSGVLGNEALTGGAWLAALPCLVALPAAPMFAVLADVRGRKTGAFCIGLIFIISWCLAAWCGGRGIWAARVAAGAGGAGALALAPLCGILFAYTGGGLLSAHALSLVMAEVRIRTSGSYSRHDLGRDESDTFQPMLKRNSGLESNSEKRSEKQAGSMLCGTALVLGAAVACGSVDRVGRKTLLLWSCSGIAFCLAVLGVYCDPHLNSITHKLLSYKKIVKDKTIKDRIYFENITSYNDSIKYNETKPWHRLSSDNISYVVEWPVKIDQSDADDVTIWLPVILLSMVLFFYNIGLGSVPYVLVTELFSINVRSLASSFLIAWMWLSNFLVLRYYGTIAFSLGLHAAYYISSSITLLGAWYIYLILPETKGKSQSQIDESLKGPWILMMEKRKIER
ncbi:unnamed protein product [Leptidea sinapis]|uniref:Major facilitator superfamily (MFS) profile domain-containing protein n=1 Tax=Leptidea sinapis TaxID=189913 RepID=A0A5E4QQM7_9NEOP|nr:unnamed protein product [Leptidea sinapis]